MLQLPYEHPSHVKKKLLRFEDLEDLIKCYNPKNRHQRKATGDEKTSLDVFWLKDKSLTDLDTLPEPNDLVEDISENLEARLDSFSQIAARLGT